MSTDNANVSETANTEQDHAAGQQSFKCHRKVVIATWKPNM